MIANPRGDPGGLSPALDHGIGIGLGEVRQTRASKGMLHGARSLAFVVDLFTVSGKLQTPFKGYTAAVAITIPD